MSASAATARRSPLPEWCQKDGRWTPTPNSFFDRLPRALSIFEHAITGFILRATVGNHVEGRPEWAQISENRFAALVDGSVNGVSKAIERLEATGVIESRKVGRSKEYRCCIEQWDRVQLRGPRRIERNAVADDEPEECSASIEQDVPRAAKRNSGSEAPHVTCPACLGGGSVSQDVAAIIVNALSENKALNEGIPPLECGIPVTVSVTVPAGDDYVSMDSPPEDGEGFSDFLEFVDGELRTKLASPAPREMMLAQWRRLKQSGVDLEYFRARFGMRKHAIRSYGFISMLVDDCVRAAEDARASEQRAASEPAQDWTATIKRHVQAKVKAISDSRLARQIGNVLPFRELVEALKSTGKDAARWADDIQSFELQMGNCEAMMRSIVEDVQSGDDRAAIDDAVERAVGPYRARMPKQQFDQVKATTYEARLFEHHGLPRLGLYCA